MSARILIVEDEKDIRDLLKDYLIRAGYEVDCSGDGLSALSAFAQFKPHVVVLDRMLPGISGDQVCEEIRKLSDIPILMLTAKSDEVSRIEGFEMGVDDYVTKPFSAKEIVYRVKVLLKRAPVQGGDTEYDDGYLKLDFSGKNIYVKGDEVHTTANEMDIIETLWRNRPNTLSRSQLVEKSFGYGYEAYDRNVDTYIKNIRHKIEKNPKKPEYVMTKYGLGYYFGKK